MNSSSLVPSSSRASSVRHRVGEALREALRETFDFLGLALDGLQCVCAGLEQYADERCRLAVHTPDELVVRGSELDARHVLEAQDRAVGIGTDDYVLEL